MAMMMHHPHWMADTHAWFDRPINRYKPETVLAAFIWTVCPANRLRCNRLTN